MNKQKFLHLLRNQSQLSPEQLAELNNVISEHPYFQNARILLAKGEKSNASEIADDLVNSAAVYASDRALLRKFVNNKLFFIYSKEDLDKEESVEEDETPQQVPEEKPIETPKAQEKPVETPNTPTPNVEKPVRSKEEIKKLLITKKKQQLIQQKKQEIQAQKQQPSRPVSREELIARKKRQLIEQKKQEILAHKQQAGPPLSKEELIAKKREALIAKKKALILQKKKELILKKRGQLSSQQPKGEQDSTAHPTAPPKQSTEEFLKEFLAPEDTHLDDLIAEVYQDIENLRESRARFDELERKLEEEEAVEKALNQASKHQAAATEEESKAAKSVDSEEDNVEAEILVPETKPIKTEKVSEAEDQKEEEEEKEEKSTPKKAEKAGNKKKTTAKKSSVKSEAKTVEEEKKKPTKKSSSAKTTKATTKKKEAKPSAKKAKSKRAVKTESESPEPKQAAKKQAVKKKAPAKSKEKEQKDDDDKYSSARGKKTYRSIKREDLAASATVDDQVKIIKNFMDKEPSIKRPSPKEAAKPTSNEDLSQESTRFQADIGTEYLAEIYIEQEKYSRAIAIYENLTLKYPEKKSFFARKIEELKKK
ncbi:MAG: hypothetical protein JXQ90_09235 [Cyclobacteriaceae bacterium]